MKYTTYCTALIFGAMSGAGAMQLDNSSGHEVMSVYADGWLVQGDRTRMVTRSFQNGTTGKTGEIRPNRDFKDYNSKVGPAVADGNRFYFIGGEGTVNNKPWQPVANILTGTVNADGKIENLKFTRPLPFPAIGGRALIHGKKLYYLGGAGHRELIAADLLPNGELGEWKNLTPYPDPVYSGGFAFYKGCFYANGKSTWKPGSSKMFALKLTPEGTGKWERVESPEEAQGALAEHDGALYYFDARSGNIYKTTQEPDGVQLKEWVAVGKMPCPPQTEGVAMTPVPGGLLFHGGFLPKKADGKFAGFYNGDFVPFTALK